MPVPSFAAAVGGPERLRGWLPLLTLVVAPLAAQPLPTVFPSAPERPGGEFGFAPPSVGTLAVRPHLSYRYEYNDGLLIRPGRTIESEEHSFAAGLLVEFGERSFLDYTATWNSRSAIELDDSLDHDLRFFTARNVGEIGVSLAHQFTTASRSLIDTARQTKLQTHTTDVEFGFPLPSERMSGAVSFGQKLNFVEATPDVYEWSVTPGLRYIINPRALASLGLTSGYQMIVRASDIVYFRPQLAVVWSVGDKTNVSATAGAEHRQYVAGRNPDSTSPIYGLSLKYRVFEHTQVGVSLSRQSGVSFFSRQSNETLSGSLELTQRLLGRLLLSLGATRRQVSYEQSPDVPTPARDDDGTSYSATLSTAVLERGQVTLGYSRTENDSNLTGFNLDSAQINVAFSYSF